MKEIIKNITAILIPISMVGALYNDVLLPIKDELYEYALPILLVLMLSILLFWIFLAKSKNNQDNLNVKRTKLIERCLTGSIILTVLCIASFWLKNKNFLATEKDKTMGKDMSNNIGMSTRKLIQLEERYTAYGASNIPQNMMDQLDRANKQRKDSIITDEEYKILKKNILE